MEVSETATGGGRAGQSDTKVVVIITVHCFMTHRNLPNFNSLSS